MPVGARLRWGCYAFWLIARTSFLDGHYFGCVDAESIARAPIELAASVNFEKTKSSFWSADVPLHLILSLHGTLVHSGDPEPLGNPPGSGHTMHELRSLAS